MASTNLKLALTSAAALMICIPSAAQAATIYSTTLAATPDPYGMGPIPAIPTCLSRRRNDVAAPRQKGGVRRRRTNPLPVALQYEKAL